MAEFPSEAWFAALSQSIETQSKAWSATLDGEVVIEIAIRDRTDTTARETRWHVVVQSDALKLVVAQATHPTITILTDVGVLDDIAAGALNAQQAIDADRLKVRGDLNRLANLSSALSALAAASHAASNAARNETSHEPDATGNDKR